MSGICERGLMLMLKKFGILGALSELLQPHLFGRTGALRFGTIKVHLEKDIKTANLQELHVCQLIYHLSKIWKQ